MHRFLALGLAVMMGLGAHAAFAANKATQQVDKTPSVIFTVPDLPYRANALGKVIDKETMQLHHGKHHAAYVANLNKEVAATPALQGKTLEQIFAKMEAYKPAVRNNAGGHYNHSLFWRLMAPQGKGGQPSDALLARIKQDFGSMDQFKDAFVEAGTKQFGSGWVWLIWTGKKLEITSTANQDNPLMATAAIKGQPILANDVWEHAYYLNYQNKRDAYLKNWWNITNWHEVNRLFNEAIAH
jgi:Fe-Mn family superoxide dismutase